MRVVETSSSSSRRYTLAQVAEVAGRGHFEECTILLHLFAGLGLVIADLNYCQA